MKFDIHVHTTLSSCSQLKLEDILKRAKSKGLDGVCLTDHQTMDVLDEIKEGLQDDGLCLIAGMEYSTPDGDFLIFGDFYDVPKDMSAQDLLQRVERAGGVAVAAHPFREGRKTNVDVVAQQYCRIIEGRNGRDNASGQVKAADWQKRFKVSLAGGSDAHSLEELGKTVTVFERAVSSKSEFIEALKNGNYYPAANERASIPS